MTKYPFIYQAVIAWDNEYRLESGVGIAESYADAMRILDEDTFRDDLIAIKHLELLDCSDTIVLPWEICKRIASDEYIDIPQCDVDGNLIYAGNEYGHVNDEDAFGHAPSDTPKGDFEF